MASPLAVPRPPCPSRSRLPRWVASLVLLASAGAGCRTGAPARPGAPSAGPDFIRSYVGRAGILRHRGDQKKWSVDRKDAERQSGECDVAVVVTDAAFQKGAVELRLAYVGQPRIEGWRNRCRRQVPEVALQITGFRPDEPAPAVTSVIGRLVATPEAWLAAHRMRFDFPPVGEPKLVADRSTVGKEGELRLGREVTRWPRRLLWVEPAYADPRKKIRHEGEIEIAGIAGSDGHLYAMQVLTPLSETQEQHVLRVSPLWRFEPARKRGNEPVAARVTERTIFRIF